MVIEHADRFLADCVRAALTGLKAQPWPDEISSSSDYQDLALRASFHGIAVLLGNAPHVMADWPAPVVEELRREMRLAALWEALHRAKITEIIARLTENGVDTMLLKGTALAYLFYDEPAARRRGDTDLLIQPNSLARARATLEDAGCFRREDPHGLHFQETWLVDCGAGMVHAVDLHWQPSDRPILQKILNADRLWQGRVPVARLSPHASAPDPVMMLVHGAINQAWHVARGYGVENQRVTGQRRLIWAVDYLRLTGGFGTPEWEELAAFCEEYDAAAIVHAALAGAQQDIGLTVPAPMMERLKNAGRASAAYDYISKPGVGHDFWIDLKSAETSQIRFELIRGMAFAPRSHLIQKYPRCSHWPTAMLQLRRYADAMMRWRKPDTSG